jgi:two-component system CheB/CheR fusion protein
MSQRTFTPHQLKIASDPEEPHSSPPVVAMIVGAGDVSVFERFFHRLPLSLGVCYLIMEYPGSPGGRGTGEGAAGLSAMLERTTLLPVRMAVQDTLLERDHIYLLPPGRAIELVRGRVIFQGVVANSEADYLADLFLASVGTGSPGKCAVFLLPDMAARVLPGLRVVRDEGGFTILLDEQNPFASPHPVYRCPLIDLFLTADLAASRLEGLADYFRGASDEHRDRSATVDWNGVYRLLLDRKDFDYSRYRQHDIVGRIHRRMAIHEIRMPDAYIATLESEEEELNRLNDELQSTVSGFFMDHWIEEGLQEVVLLRLLEAEQRSAPLRVWLPHCTGGHEAYAVAITILECLEVAGSNLSVQLFVTCLNNNSVAKARRGTFGPAEMHYLTRGRRKKFFLKKEREWQVVKGVREKCVFAVHDLLKDSPFSHMDMIIESGSLIAFDADACARAFRLFHFALAPDGYFIANTQCPHFVPADLYASLEGCNGIYAKRAVAVNFWQDGARCPAGISPVEMEADKLILSGHVPASFLVDEQLRVIRRYGNTEAYLRASRDPSSDCLFRIVRDELVFELDDLVELTEREGRAVTRKGIQLCEDSLNKEVSLEMVPLRLFGGNRKLIIIRDIGMQTETIPSSPPGADRLPSGQNRRIAERLPSSKDRRIQATEKEIQEMRGLLLAADLDTRRLQAGLLRSNEELQAMNEEYQSLNKELQGSNGELNNLYAELLARNKELHLLNEGLHAHIREIHSTADAAMAIVATLRRPIVVLRDDLRVHTANRAFLHLFDLSSETVVGQCLGELGPDLFHQEVIRLRLKQVQMNKLGAEFELRHLARQGGERILHFSATKMAGLPGLRSGILLSIDDVTDHRNLQKFKDDLIGLATHELRTPATSIRAYAELLSQELMETGDRKSAYLVRKLNGQVDRLSGLTRDLMDVSRISRGLIVLEEESFDLNELIAEVAGVAQPKTPVTIFIDPLPPSPPVHGDRERIGRVLGNLLSNAATYAGHSGQIGIGAVVTQKDVRLSIYVTGSDMPVEQMRKIFAQDYPCGNGSSNSLPSISLGLYISSEIVRKHGGSISVTSENDKKSVITVVLPFDKKRVAELSAV